MLTRTRKFLRDVADTLNAIELVFIAVVLVAFFFACSYGLARRVVVGPPEVPPPIEGPGEIRPL